MFERYLASRTRSRRPWPLLLFFLIARRIVLHDSGEQWRWKMIVRVCRENFGGSHRIIITACLSIYLYNSIMLVDVHPPTGFLPTAPSFHPAWKWLMISNAGRLLRSNPSFRDRTVIATWRVRGHCVIYTRSTHKFAYIVY